MGMLREVVGEGLGVGKRGEEVLALRICDLK